MTDDVLSEEDKRKQRESDSLVWFLSRAKLSIALAVAAFFLSLLYVTGPIAEPVVKAFYPACFEYINLLDYTQEKGDFQTQCNNTRLLFIFVLSAAIAALVYYIAWTKISVHFNLGYKPRDRDEMDVESIKRG